MALLLQVWLFSHEADQAKEAKASILGRNLPISAAFQGELGAFSHAAATKLLGSTVKVVPCESFKAVFEALARESVTYAVIPIENTLHGSVHENYDNLLDSDSTICGETSIRISHHLIVVPGTRFRQIERAFSHPVALNQCRIFFENHPAIAPVTFYDTAGSVKMLTQDRPPRAAAIASETAAEIYGASILKRNLEDNSQNFTRFFLLSKQRPRKRTARAPWKTSLVFSTANAPGALFKALACFALRDLSLSKIESRPLRNKPWEYLFYVDVLGALSDKLVESALTNLSETTTFLRVLGSYQPTP